MWSFFRFASRAKFARADGQALACLNDLYRVAYFLVGDRAAAEELVQATYQKVWRQSNGRKVGNWRLALFRSLLALAEPQQIANALTQAGEKPPLWGVLSRLDFEARSILLLDTLNLPSPQIALIVNRSEAHTAQRLQAARNKFLTLLS